MEDLKKKAMKKGADITNIALNRRISIPLSIRLMNTRITPNHVTTLSLTSSIIAGFFFSYGIYPHIIFAAIFVQVYITLDLMDGEIARLKNMKSQFGRWFEGVSDNIATAAFLIGITFGALKNPTLLFGLYTFSPQIIYITGILAVIGYYIAGHSFYYGMICFQRELTFHSKPRGTLKVLFAIIKGYSRGLQILIFTFAGLFNHLFLGLFLFALWSNLIWLGRIIKYAKKYSTEKL